MYTTEAATLADTLDGLGAGLFVVDAAGRIVHANASGRAMLQERRVLRAADGRLAACEPRAAAALKRLLAGAVGAGAGPTALPLSASDGAHYVAHLLPLAAGARRSEGGGSAVAAVFVQRAAIGAHCPPETIAELYNLTPCEVRVLLAIVEVGGVPETAQALGVAEATVKTHLHRVFSKTGATRQADLVKLVAGFSNPLLRASRPLAPPQREEPRGGPRSGLGRIALSPPARPSQPGAAKVAAADGYGRALAQPS
jgi:DNA-binding CsgD family transcriptional regulator